MTAELVCAATDPAWTVRVQQAGTRFGYVIEEPGWPLYVSAYRWHTAEAARRAGERDAKRASGGKS